MKSLLTALSLLLIPLTVHAVPIQTYSFTIETTDAAVRITGEVRAEDSGDGIISTGEVQDLQLFLDLPPSLPAFTSFAAILFNLNTTTSQFELPTVAGVPSGLITFDDMTGVATGQLLVSFTPSQPPIPQLFFVIRDTQTFAPLLEIQTQITGVQLIGLGPTPVPEPSPIALLSAGILAFGFATRKRRNRIV